MDYNDGIDMSVTTPRDALIALSTLCEPGNAELAALLAEYGPVETLDRLLHRAATSPLQRTVVARLGGKKITERIAAVHDATVDCNSRVITAADDEWPTQLDDLAALFDESEPHTQPPICLWLRGPQHLAQSVSTSVSIIGARACTSYGRGIAFQFGYELAQSGWSVVSGGAYGIDEAAHRGTLSGAGVTIAVLACGVDRPYPLCNTDMFNAIADTGLLLSEWPPGSIPQRFRFLVRNRVIAAISSGTVVVEAAVRSGARQTARRVWELDRPLMLVPGPITSQSSVGVHQLARGPVTSRIVTRASEIIEDLGPIGGPIAPQLPTPQRIHDTLDPLADRVLDAAPLRKFASVEHLAMQAGVSTIDVARTIPHLLMKGLLQEREGQYRLAPSNADTRLGNIPWPGAKHTRLCTPSTD